MTRLVRVIHVFSAGKSWMPRMKRGMTDGKCAARHYEARKRLGNPAFPTLSSRACPGIHLKLFGPRNKSGVTQNVWVDCLAQSGNAILLSEIRISAIAFLFPRIRFIVIAALFPEAGLVGGAELDAT